MTFTFDVSTVVSKMLSASSGITGVGDKGAIDMAKQQYESIISDIETLQTKVDNGTMSKADAQEQFDQYKLSMQIALEAIDVLKQVNLQNDINAAIKILNAAIEAALGGSKLAFAL